MAGTQCADELSLVIITGLSGAGKSQAMKCFEDLGFFCIDNLPPALVSKFAELCKQASGQVKQVALVMDIRGGTFFDDILRALSELEEQGTRYKILFLEASDETLVKRFKETRRKHPLASEGGVLKGIREERRRLEVIRGRAHFVIDTSGLTPLQLKEQITKLFAENSVQRLFITVMSFGFKYGLPLDADLVFDARFLPNPYYVEELKSLPGTDSRVRSYVLRFPVTRKFLSKVHALIQFLIPYFIAEGKTQLTIAIGCTGGQHRSVVIADELARLMSEQHPDVRTEHRDLEREVKREAGTVGR
ncbi:MAG TPA: RNase adapter RapZ [Firmicutes bacterium]|nr:RNase adapter RapZ [Bacillota bacterium]